MQDPSEEPEYLPAEQLAHDDKPAPLKVPASQATHESKVEDDLLPASHGEQEELSIALYRPTEQVEQTVKPIVAPNDPAAQEKHAALSGQYLPTEQKQVIQPADSKEIAPIAVPKGVSSGQLVQIAAPVVLGLNVPAGQMVQTAEPETA